MYNRKPNSRCFGVNLDGHLDKTQMSLVNHACALIVGETI